MRKMTCFLLIAVLAMLALAGAALGESTDDRMTITQGDSLVMSVGASENLRLEFEAKLRRAKKTTVWSSDNEAVAAVSQKGQVTALANGEANITCESTIPDGSVLKAVCKVSVITQVKGATLESDSMQMGVGQIRQLQWSVEPEDATNPGFAWSSENPGVATVDGGRVTAVAEGKTKVIGTAVDGSDVTMTCEVTVSALYADVGTVIIDDMEEALVGVHYVGNFNERYAVEADESIISWNVEPVENTGDQPDQTANIRIWPRMAGETVMKITDLTNPDVKAEIGIVVTDDGISNSQKLVVTKAELLPNAQSLTYRLEVQNNSNQEIGEIGFLVDYRDQFRDTHYCFSNTDGTIQGVRYTSRVSILPGKTVSVAGRNDSFLSDDLITEIRVAICYYRYVESAEKIYIPDSQLYWFSTKYGEMERPAVSFNYVAPDQEILDKAERMKLGATTCDLYSFVCRVFARSYRPGRYISIVGEDGYCKYWGLEAGDVIYGADGILWTDDPFCFEKALAKAYNGMTVPLMVVRNGEEITINAMRMPKATPTPLPQPTPGSGS